jgi:hypothetical protein
MEGAVEEIFGYFFRHKHEDITAQPMTEEILSLEKEKRLNLQL